MFLVKAPRRPGLAVLLRAPDSAQLPSAYPKAHSQTSVPGWLGSWPRRLVLEHTVRPDLR